MLPTTRTTRKISSVDLHDNTILHETVDHNDSIKLQKLMAFVKNKVYNINYPDVDWNSRTPLHIACAYGYGQCCKILLENGADKDAKMLHGRTSAHYAAENGHLEILQVCFYFDANLHEKDYSDETPLQLATNYKHSHCVCFIKDVERFGDIVDDEKERFFEMDITLLEQQDKSVNLEIMNVSIRGCLSNTVTLTEDSVLKGYIITMQQAF